MIHKLKLHEKPDTLALCDTPLIIATIRGIWFWKTIVWVCPECGWRFTSRA